MLTPKTKTNTGYIQQTKKKLRQSTNQPNTRTHSRVLLVPFFPAISLFPSLLPVLSWCLYLVSSIRGHSCFRGAGESGKMAKCGAVVPPPSPPWPPLLLKSPPQSLLKDCLRFLVFTQWRKKWRLLVIIPSPAEKKGISGYFLELLSHFIFDPI